MSAAPIPLIDLLGFHPPAVVRMALRGLRRPGFALVLLLLAVSLGVALLTAVSVGGQAIGAALQADARQRIGGDISIRLFHRLPSPAERAALSAQGRLGEIVTLRRMLRAKGGSVLAEVKGVDAAWPLLGAARLDPPLPLSQALERRDGRWGAAAAPELLQALGLAPGDMVELGPLTLEIRARLLAQPDEAGFGVDFGPPLLVPLASLAEAGLLAEGGGFYWYGRLLAPEGRSGAEMLAALEVRFPDAGWRLVNAAEGVPGTQRIVVLAEGLLSLLALVSLLIAGIGIAGAAAAHLRRARPELVIPRALGAPPLAMFLVAFLRILLVAQAGAVLGAIAGWLLGWGAAALLAPLFGLDAVGPPSPVPALIAMIIGMLAALIASLPALARAVNDSPQTLLRDMASDPTVLPRWRVALTMAALTLLMLALVVMGSPVPVMAAIFLTAAGLGAATLLGIGGLARGLARHRHPRWVPLRLALSRIASPGSLAPSLTLSVGLALALLLSLAILVRAADGHLAETVPRNAPALVALDLPPGQADRVAAAARAAGAVRVRAMPFVHGRLTHLGGIPVSRLDPPADMGFVIRGDRGLTWAREPPPGTVVSAGAWWPADHAGPVLAAMDERVARRLGLALGDGITVNLLGRPVTARVAVLRQTDPTGLDLEPPIILSPPDPPPPHTEVLFVWAPEAARPAIAAAIAQAAPAAALLDLAPLLAQVEGLVGDAASGFAGMLGSVAVAGVLVLAGGLAGGFRERIMDGARLRLLGASRRWLLLAGGIELGLMALLAALVAVPLAMALAGGVVARLAPDARLLPDGAMIAALFAVAVTLAAIGVLTAHAALRRSPAALLRREHD